MAADRIHLKLQEYVSQLVEQYPLRNVSSLPVGGVADYFTEANTMLDLISAVSGAISTGIPYIVIGQGQRTLFSDGGFPGLVIRNLTDSIARSSEHSQAVVDSGVTLNRLVTVMASYGLGGLAPFYGQLDSIGGALYSNLMVPERLISIVRQLTVLMPPNKLRSEPKIVRQSASWLLEHRNSIQNDLESQPVLLTATLQLTSKRDDELLGEVKSRVQNLQTVPKRSFGPIFELLPDQNIDELLASLNAKLLRVGACTVNRKNPNYLVFLKPTVQAHEIRAVIEMIQQIAEEQFGVTLISRYAYLGVW